MLQIFPDIERPLRKILDICEKDGFIFATGLFNKHDIEVRLQYCDNTQEITKGLWRIDWNQHSQASISRLIGDSVKSMEFEEMIMDLDLPLRPDQPIRHFTFRDSMGRNIITNGLKLILNRTLMTINK